MRALIGKILAGIATLVLVPMELVVNGVRQIVHMLMPTRNTAADDEAIDVIDEPQPPAPVAADGDTLPDARRAARRPEAKRVKTAAGDMAENRAVPASCLDPADLRDAEIIKWMKGLSHAQLGTVRIADEVSLTLHLAGARQFPVPLLPRHQSIIQARIAAAAPLSFHEWVIELMRRRSEAGDEVDHRDMEEIEALAVELADRGATLADYPEPRPVELERFRDDRGEVE